MMEVLLQLDTLLFRAINSGMANSVFDVLMPIVTSFRWWIPVFALGIGWLVIWGQRRGRLCALLMVVSVIVADPLTNRVIKPLFARERPCRQELHVVMRISGAEGPSFPSSHAVNMAAIAAVLVSFYRRAWWVWVMLAGTVGFSRVYVGVHYPGDVLFGWILGATIGGAVVKVVRRRYEHKSAVSMTKRRLRWW
jgi:undecaprenyl-diphosphatase